MGTHPIFESDFDCLTGNSFEVMEDQINKKAGANYAQKSLPIKVDTDMKYDTFLNDLLDELNDKDEFEERFDNYLKDELDKYKRSEATIDDKVKTMLECFKENAGHFDEDDLAEAKERIRKYYPQIYKNYF